MEHPAGSEVYFTLFERPVRCGTSFSALMTPITYYDGPEKGQVLAIGMADDKPALEQYNGVNTMTGLFRYFNLLGLSDMTANELFKCTELRLCRDLHDDVLEC